ncbi:MAG: chromate transporter [Chloroflexi bacterium]|nr:chromate transporter [Chloroflexota bacterium]
MTKRVELSVWLRLFWLFIKINLLSTSGPASIVLLYKEAVDSIMSEEQFIEAVGFSNVLPGSEALKLAMFVGYAAGGIPGTIAALLGSILPPAVFTLAAVALLEQFQDAAWMQGFVKGLSPAVAMLMIVVAWKIFKGGNAGKVSYRVWLITALSFLAFFLDAPSPLVLVGAGVLGVVLFR